METDKPKCPRCASTWLYAFQVSPETRTKPENLPVVCRNCGQVTIAGDAVTFPPGLEAAAKSMAQAADEAGQQMNGELKDDPDPQIAKYFAKVYRTAYLDGFWRALAFGRHHLKEGRLKRLRELWRQVAVTHTRSVHRVKLHPEDVEDVEVRTTPIRTVLEMSEADYTEFAQLLELGAPDDGPPSSNPDPSVPLGTS